MAMLRGHLIVLRACACVLFVVCRSWPAQPVFFCDYYLCFLFVACHYFLFSFTFCFFFPFFYLAFP